MKNPRIILITGASSGIGRALSDVYAAPGVTLLLTGRDLQRLEEARAAAMEKGATVHTITTDVATELFAKQIAEWDALYPIDLVIANAGVSGGMKADTAQIFSTNMLGTIHTVEPLIPRMTSRRRGQIALMSSMAGWRGMPGAPAYSASKVAVRAWGEALRPVLARQGVKLSVIYPGFVDTPLTRVNPFRMPFLMTAEKAAHIIKRGLEKDCARIVFPHRMYVLARLIAALPRAIGDFILMKAPSK